MTRYKVAEYIGVERRMVITVECSDGHYPHHFPHAELCVAHYYLSDNSGGPDENPNRIVPSDPLETFQDRVRVAASEIFAEVARDEGERDAAQVAAKAHLKVMNTAVEEIAIRLGWQKQ